MNNYILETEVAENEDYQALTEREETDLQQLMSQCGYAVSNAEAFMETLAKDLSILDGVGIIINYILLAYVYQI